MSALSNHMPDTGAHLLAQTLHRFGVRHVFHIPGEGILEPLDALAQTPGMTLTACRHEAGMAYAAQGYARRLGGSGNDAPQPGICLAARAPGALNTMLALHTADTDAVPLILIIGQAAMMEAGGDPLSGFDLGEVFRPLVKGVLPAMQADRLPEVMAQAWHLATSARMGPVVVLVPENVWQQRTGAALLDAPACAQPAPSTAAIADFQALARNPQQPAQRPLLLIGGSGWQTADFQALQDFVQHSRWPVACAYRRTDLLNHDDAHFVGEIGIGADAALLRAVGEADLIVAVNLRLGEINTFGSSGGFGGWRLLARPRPQQRLVHVHADARELQRNYQADLALTSGPGEFLRAAKTTVTPLPPNSDWLAQLRQARLDFVCNGAPCPGPVDVRTVMQTLRQQLPPETPVCVGAGAYAVWLHRYFSFHRPATLLGPKSGAMGYGLAAAIGAARADTQTRPHPPILALAGDGCLQMHGEELASAVQYRLPILLVVVNNAAWGAIESTQRHLFGRATDTRLNRVDFAAWARSMGACGLTVQETAEFAPALAQALATLKDGPAVIDLRVQDGLGKPQ